MPGIVVFQRRWSVGSDDLVVPGLFLFIIHIIWLFILSSILLLFEYDSSIKCVELLKFYIVAYICLLSVLSINELCICIISMRGGILQNEKRSSMQYWLYIRLILMLIDFGLLISAIVWFKEYYLQCPLNEAKEVVMSSVICNLLVELTLIMTMYCSFDPAGRSWFKMKQYQRSMRESESRFNYRRSGSRSRNWRQRKVMRAYQENWNQRCKLLFCCMGSSDRSRNSFTDIARLLSDFFRDLDVVPTDVVAGLVLLRKFQKLEREAIVRQRRHGIYEYLSGVPITERTKFLALNDSRDYEHFQSIIHYMYFAMASYGWPMYLITHKSGICDLFPKLKCCNLFRFRQHDNAKVIEDNCCLCNYTALKEMIGDGDVEITYVTYHVDIGETPFFVAVDYARQKIVISIRGTLSMKDILTDLNAEGEPLPLNSPREEFLGHKGMVQAAVYIRNKLQEENLIDKALNHCPERGTQNFGLIITGHSLGGGTAAILAILLKQDFANLECYSYSPPGGLLSMPAVKFSYDFITSVVVGKDVVPRIGLHQMESLRADLINAIQRSIDPKWKTIACNMICCCCGPEPSSVMQMSEQDSNVNAYNEQKEKSRHSSVHPSDKSIALTLHHPLYPPGRIVHIVRHHTTQDEQAFKHEPVYQAIWANTTDFDEVLISPVMLQDHMPETVLSALEKVVTTFGPRKPQRCKTPYTQTDNTLHNMPQSSQLLQQQPLQYSNELSGNHTSVQSKLTPNSQRLLLETSFGSPPNLRDERKMNRKERQNGQSASNKKPLKSVAFSNNGVSYPPPKFKPTTLSLCETRPNPFQGKIVDLIYDDWFGLAPLASPESLSELSSISSRASISLNLNLSNSIEKFLNKVTSNKNPSPPLVAANTSVNDIDDSQTHTPKIIRRTPKISENLSSCAMDWKAQNSYKRMGKIFLSNPPTMTGSDSDDGSYGTAESLPKKYNNIDGNQFIMKDENKDWKSADNIDNDLVRNHNNAAISDSAMINDCKSQCPVCPCTKLPPEKCCRRIDHISCIMLSAQEYHASGKYSIANTTSSSDTYYSLTGSECGGLLQNGTKVLMSKLGTYEEETLTCELPTSQNINPSTISSITRSGILESHFPVYFDSSDEKSSLLSHENSPCQRVKATCSSGSGNILMRKKSNDEEFSVFSRNESLPLLNLVEKSSPTNYVKRKRIHPIHTPPIIQNISPKIVPMTKHSRSTPASITNLYVFNESHV
ncbi:hypothetical protein PVAND_010670 [Polypedilum vanderplanki]|uniref:Diacylglycerol lipase-alpha n=1 Tax=Polypedilum vanderplanki TaxID=319348 RepID=A0A9J6CH95_POLVA|nr:hypothetical protein PVAND_010670 [Polypedilum vanderplanki]